MRSVNSGLIESKTSVKTRSIDDFDFLDEDFDADGAFGAGLPVSVSWRVACFVSFVRIMDIILGKSQATSTTGVRTSVYVASRKSIR